MEKNCGKKKMEVYQKKKVWGIFLSPPRQSYRLKKPFLKKKKKKKKKFSIFIFIIKQTYSLNI